MSNIRFGTAGQNEAFKQARKKMVEIPAYLAEMGLDAFEYQCGRGVRLAKETAEELAAEGRRLGVEYSLHAPYYISMSSLEEAKRLGSLRYIRESAAAVKALGGRRVVFHAGSCGRQSREEALYKAKNTLAQMQEMLDAEGFDNITLCPETMGKMGQLGTLDEVLALCGIDRRITPCIDFGHLNARTLGSIRGERDYAAILNRMEDVLADERAKSFHVHFSKIEYTAGGEKRHLTFEDTTFGPDFEPFLELCYKRGLSPVIICESAGTQAEDAAVMAAYYRALG